MGFFDSVRDGFERVKGAVEKERQRQDNRQSAREQRRENQIPSNNSNTNPVGSWGAGQEGLNPWERTPFGQVGSYFGGVRDEAESDRRYEAAYGPAAMNAIRARRQEAINQGYGSLAEMNYYESMGKNPISQRPQQPYPSYPYPSYPGYPMPWPSPYPYPGGSSGGQNGGINPGGLYGGGYQPQPPRGGYDGGGINPGGKYDGGGQVWAGGNPYFNEQTGQYQNPYLQQQQYNQLQQQLQLLQQQIQMPQQSNMNWDSIFSTVLPMVLGSGGMGGFGGSNPYGGMGGYGGYSPYGGY